MTTRFNNQLKTVLLLGALSALLIGLGALVAPGQLYLFGILALALNLGAYFFSDRIVLAMHHARPIAPHEAPELHAVVQELATRAAIPTPRLYLVEEQQPNAFATGRNPAHGVVAVTSGLLELLETREVRGVLAHEIAHIANRDILVSTIAAAIASMVTYVAHALGFAAFFGGGQSDEGEEGGSAAGGLLFALLAPLAATLVQLGISRSREFLADETGARLAGDARGLASALAKLHRGAELIPSAAPPATASLFIVSPFAGAGSLLRWFSTHPPVEERIARLEQLEPARPAFAARW